MLGFISIFTGTASALGTLALIFMTTILNIELIDKGFGSRGHEDILFSIPRLGVDQECDLYYFSFSKDSDNTFDDTINAFCTLIEFWREKTLECNDNSTIYLPIDFSDEYSGCLKLKREDKNLILTYGYSLREGWSIDPMRPEDYYKEITDFKADPDLQLAVDRGEFLNNLDSQIQKIRNKENIKGYKKDV